MNFLFDSLSKVEFATHTTGEYRPNRDGNRDPDIPERQVAVLFESQRLAEAEPLSTVAPHPRQTQATFLDAAADPPIDRDLSMRFSATATHLSQIEADQQLAQSLPNVVTSQVFPPQIRYLT
ncbi:MAG: hypothetical protein P8N76_03030 [Pirellulaceae bacterium]|nr:hypothetical protein [Pirellulaceae bacterium]